jgi:hypothetical protein
MLYFNFLVYNKNVPKNGMLPLYNSTGFHLTKCLIKKHRALKIVSGLQTTKLLKFTAHISMFSIIDGF